MAAVSNDLQMFISHRRTATVLEVGGEIDAASVDTLHDHLQLAVNEGCADVFVDMSLVTFCDSIGLRALVGAERDLRGAGRHLRIVNPSVRVARLLELTGLDGLEIGSGPHASPELPNAAPVTDW